MFTLFQMDGENPMGPTGFRYEDCAIACRDAWDFANQPSNQYRDSITYLVQTDGKTIYQAWWDDDIKHVIQNAQKNTPAKLYLGGLGGTNTERARELYAKL